MDVFCVDCKHYWKDTSCGRVAWHSCKRTTSPIDINLVTGEDIMLVLDAEKERKPNKGIDTCGNRGVYFEPIKADESKPV